MKKNIEVIILAGGFGSRLDEITKVIPKPLVKIGGLPIIEHIIKFFVKSNSLHFIIALGYKGEKIVEYFTRKKITQKIQKNLKKGYVIKKTYFEKKCTIKFLDTGLKTMTGGRVKQSLKLVQNKNCFLTYGDGISNVNLKKLFKLHEQKKKLVTVTAVNPQSRFGELKIRNKKVVDFSEKHKMLESWINGGFFVINKKFIKLIKNNSTILEREPLEKAARSGELVAYKHFGFWQCMDTKRDKDNLNRIFKKNKKFI